MILGIDPGPTESAYCLWDGSKIHRMGVVFSQDIRHTLRPGMTVACEHLQCFGMAVGREVFETAYWIGEFRGECRVSGLPFVRVMRTEIKMHFCNSMRAKDSNIRAALIDRFGAPGKKASPGLTYGLKGDIWSAFAIAVYATDKQ